jgi:hypothetical protein
LTLRQRQPEIFETSDVPETVPPVALPEDVQNEDIDRTVVRPNQAFTRFADKPFSPAAQDFSGSLKRKARSHNQQEFEGEGAVGSVASFRPQSETPLQRFQRLQFEVQQLGDELKAAAKARTPIEQDIPPLDLSEELELLQSQLRSLLLTEEYQPFLNPKFSTQRASLNFKDVLTKKITNEIQSLSEQSASASNTSTSEKPSITYELYCSPEGKGSGKITQTAWRELEKRVHDLEKLVGIHPLGGTEHVQDMWTLSEFLLQKVSLMDTAELNKIDRRLKLLSLEIDDVTRAEEKLAIPSVQEKKVNDLLAMMSRSDAIIRQLPTIISRLQSLQPLHASDLSYVETIERLQRQQREMTNTLKDHTTLLNQVEQNFTQNMSTVQKNVEELNKRIERIAQRLEQDETY